MSTQTLAPDQHTTDRTGDLRAVCESVAARRLLDPAVERRIRDRADQARAELRKKGATNVAVDLVREVRDEQ